MEITVYLDTLFLLNFSVDFFLLCLLRMILKLKGSIKRMAAGGAVGAGLSVMIQYIRLRMILKGADGGIFSVFSWLAAVFGSSSLMLFLSFSFFCAEEFFKAEAGLLFGAALFAGIWQWGMEAASRAEGKTIHTVSLGTGIFFFLFMGSALTARWLYKLLFRAAAESSCYYQVTLYFQGKKESVKGFMDTGNHLRDPISGRPVHVADRKLLEHICPKTNKIRMIPYQTIDKKGAVLAAVTLERMEAVQGKRRLVYEQPLIAASPKELRMKNGCRILLHE